MKFLACFGRGRHGAAIGQGSSRTRREAQQPNPFDLQYETPSSVAQVDDLPAQVAAEPTPEPDCSSPFRSANVVPLAKAGLNEQLDDNSKGGDAGLFMFPASNSSKKSATHSPHALTTSNPMANDHLEGHLLPAGLDLTTLQHLLDSTHNALTTATSSVTATMLASHGGLRPQSNPEAALSQTSGRGGAGTGGDGAPDLGGLTCEQLVRLCGPDEITSDLEGLTLLGQGRLSVACQALWRGARVVVKFSASPSLHPSSGSAVIRQALVSKALAHPNVLQHYSVRCCRLAPSRSPLGLMPPPPPPPPTLPTQGSDAVITASHGGGDKAAVSAPVSSARNAEPSARADAVAAAMTENGGGVAALHHLSGPAVTAAPADGTIASGSQSAATAAAAPCDARGRLWSGGQVADLVEGDTAAGVGGVSGARADDLGAVAAAAAAGQHPTSTIPPFLHVAPTPECEAPKAAAATTGARVLKAPKPRAARRAQGDDSGGGGGAAAAAAASAAAQPGAQQPGAAAARCMAAPMLLGASGTAAATAASPGGSLSFNSYEGFGNPFGSLRHALSLVHVAALVSAAEGDYLTAIIMEHADKSTLHHAVLRGLFAPNRVWSARVALRALLRTALELAFALQHLHGRGVVHGCLRPANVLLKSSNLDRRGFTAKVSNFSLTRVCLGEYDDMVLSPAPPGLPLREDDNLVADPEAATTGRRSGNGGRRSGGGGGGGGDGMDAAALPFWSPEQLCGVVGKPSDVYAFGVTLYYMCTSNLPYIGIPVREVVCGVAAGTLQPQWPDAAAAAAAAVVTDAAAGGATAAAAGTAAKAASAAAMPPPPAPIRALCAQCWQADPRARPTFSQVCASLQAIEYAIREQLRRPTSSDTSGGVATESPSDSGSQAQAPSAAALAGAAASAIGGGGDGGGGGRGRAVVGTLG